MGWQISEIYEPLNRHWKATCKAIFGEEVGELSEFEEWLAKYNNPLPSRKSSASGRNVSFVLPHYSKSAPIFSMDEVDFNRKFEPLNINEVKDMDSIAEAVRERIAYTGNIWLGNSQFVAESTDIMDSFYVFKSSQITSSKYIAHGFHMEFSENCFGTLHHGNCVNCIRMMDSDFLSRCFEVYGCEETADSYYSHHIFNCKNCLFCFNIRNAHHAIGNLELPQEKYLELKRKLMGEMANELRTKKELPTLLELVGNPEPDIAEMREIKKNLGKKQAAPIHPEIIESAFSKTTGVILGKSLTGIEKYHNWLSEFMKPTKRCKSALTGEEMIVVGTPYYIRYPENRLASEEESILLGNSLKIAPEELERFGLEKAKKFIGKIAYFHPGVDFGKLSNIIESHENVNATDMFRSVINISSKKCAYSYVIIESESIFGCHSIRQSGFLLRCYLSSKLNRCFEVDSSRECFDCYFCHNCENVQDSMFCFNVKNKRYAIGNSVFARDEYLRVKGMLREELVSRLKEGKGLKLNIFNIAECGKERL